MNYEKMWIELKNLLEKTSKMTALVKPTGILEIMGNLENINQYEDLPF